MLQRATPLLMRSQNLGGSHQDYTLVRACCCTGSGFDYCAIEEVIKLVAVFASRYNISYSYSIYIRVRIRLQMRAYASYTLSIRIRILNINFLHDAQEADPTRKHFRLRVLVVEKVGARALLLHVLHRQTLVDAWPVVGGVSPKRDLQLLRCK